jgi:hypothetical protein
VSITLKLHEIWTSNLEIIVTMIIFTITTKIQNSATII